MSVEEFKRSLLCLIEAKEMELELLNKKIEKMECKQSKKKNKLWRKQKVLFIELDSLEKQLKCQ